MKFVVPGADSTGKSMSFTLDMGIKDLVVSPPVQPEDLPFMHAINKNIGSRSSVTTQTKLLEFIKANGFGGISIPIYWEKYLQDPVEYTADLNETADAADLHGLKVLYSFKQFKLSSVFGGIGFPPAVVKAAIGSVSSYASELEAKRAFMRKYYDNAFEVNGQKIWDAHADFMKTILAEPYRNYASTLGYEIFNEPPVSADVDHDKLKLLQEYIGNQLVGLDPDAWICAPHRHSLGYKVDWYSIDNIKRTFPNILNNKVIYGPHIYWKQALKVPGYNFEEVAKIQLALSELYNRTIPVFVTEWDVEVFPADAAAMKSIIDAAKVRKWSLFLWIFDSADVNHRCFTDNYDVETKRNVWPALLKAMQEPEALPGQPYGGVQVDSPK
jgi:hypothetical protein